MMPVAAFPGEFGWGYDGVYWFAPTQLTERPTTLRALSIEATARHRRDSGRVYNHFGPCGNYAARFSRYFTDKHHTEWGEAINFDGPAGPVRDFVAENAAYWIREFHLDGLRLDATSRHHR